MMHFTRFVSGYRDKYVMACNSSRTCFKKKFLIPIDDSITSPLTMTELLRAFLAVPLSRINGHFRPQWWLCQLGEIPYTFIADIDNYHHTDYISRRMGVSVSFRKFTQPSGLAEQLPAFPCSRETVDLAAQLYAKDAALLGYSFDAAYRTCGDRGVSS